VPPVALRPRSTTELIDAAVQLLRHHYIELVTVSAIFVIPGLLVGVLFAPHLQPGQMPNLLNLLIFVVLGLAAGSFSLMSTAAIVLVVSDSYLGREVSIASAVQRVIHRVGSVFGASFLQSLAIGFGFLLFIVPAFIFAAWFFAATAVVVIEGKTAVAAMSRSKALAAGSVGRILGTLLLSLIIVIVIQIVVGICLSLLASLLHMGASISSLITGIANLLIYPFVTVVITLLYYDLRIRKEGFDLELMATELGHPAPSAAPVSA
jgi:hypothetical protein